MRGFHDLLRQNTMNREDGFPEDRTLQLKEVLAQKYKITTT
jgi:hypothetical protein